MNQLKLIYDFSHRSIDFESLLWPLLCVAAGFAIFYYSKKDTTQKERNRTKGIGIVFILFSGLFSAMIIPSHLKEYFTTKNIYENKKYIIVEGHVDHYHPMPWGGHDTERFEVKGVEFEYSDYDLTDYGYNNTASKGGVIKDNLYVRISYFNNGRRNVILKLETE
ncbi:MAG TPA: hypothetical protein VG890_08745 [Puia sp.]|nr:hypothetical protein [Puia sp.]